ncbi:hypothetical protein GCM10009754_08210 [Amycolatopsis minnesotensis]|uniref:Uncharacterized protein n=1 Tax=Amycolatopsis minnesotensis TaxID=337894 RepID=A0ABN2Q377_9PSEU
MRASQVPNAAPHIANTTETAHRACRSSREITSPPYRRPTRFPPPLRSPGGMAVKVRACPEGDLQGT